MHRMSQFSMINDTEKHPTYVFITMLTNVFVYRWYKECHEAVKIQNLQEPKYMVVYLLLWKKKFNCFLIFVR